MRWDSYVPVVIRVQANKSGLGNMLLTELVSRVREIEGVRLMFHPNKGLPHAKVFGLGHDLQGEGADRHILFLKNFRNDPGVICLDPNATAGR